MNNRAKMSGRLWDALFVWGCWASALGGAAYGPLVLLFSGSVPVTSIPFGGMVCGISGLALGFMFGFPINFVSSLALWAIMVLGHLEPRTSTVHRWLLCAINGGMAAVGIVVEMRLLLKGYYLENAFTPVFALPVLLAALCGAWTVYRVMTHQPRKKKKTSQLAEG